MLCLPRLNLDCFIYFHSSYLDAGQRGLSHVVCILLAYLQINPYIAILGVDAVAATLDLSQKHFADIILCMKYFQNYSAGYNYRLCAHFCQHVWPFHASLQHDLNFVVCIFWLAPSTFIVDICFVLFPRHLLLYPIQEAGFLPFPCCMLHLFVPLCILFS